MKKLLIVGVVLGCFNSLLNAGNGGAEIEEPELIRFIGLANKPYGTIDFKNNFKNRIHNANATYNGAPLLYHIVDAVENLKAAMEYLIQQGANVNYARKGTKVTPLMRAAELGKLEAVEILLKHNANPALKSDSDRTALNYATRSREKWAEKKGAEAKVAELEKIIELLSGKKPEKERKTIASSPSAKPVAPAIIQQQELKASAPQSAGAALNEIKTILLRHAQRPSFKQWFAKYDADYPGTGKGEEDFNKFNEYFQIIRGMGDNEEAFFNAFYEEYDKASPDKKVALVNSVMAFAIPIFNNQTLGIVQSNTLNSEANSSDIMNLLKKIKDAKGK